MHRESAHANVPSEWSRADVPLFVHEWVRSSGYISDGDLLAIAQADTDAIRRGSLPILSQPDQTHIETNPSSPWYGVSVGDPGMHSRFGYRGYWYEPEIGKYIVRNRVYDPRFGRWLTRDPIGYAGGWNLYRYCGGRPVSVYDPMGLWSLMRWLYTGDCNASNLVYNAALYGAGTTIPAPVLSAADVVDSRAGRTVIGAVQTAGGVMTIVGGAGLSLIGLGAPVMAIGLDMTQSGARMSISGEWTSSVLSEAIDWGADQAGIEADDRPLVVGPLTAVIQIKAAAVTAEVTPAAQARIRNAVANGLMSAGLAESMNAAMQGAFINAAFRAGGIAKVIARARGTITVSKITTKLTKYAKQAAKKLDADPNLYLSVSQQNALNAYPGVIKVFRGGHIDVMVRAAVRGDPVLGKILCRKSNHGVDYRSRIHPNARFEKTTTREWNAGKCNKHGPDTIHIPTD